MPENKINQPNNIRIWIGFFLYTLIIGLIIQLVILPHIFPAWNGGDGLLKGLDTEKFHQKTIKTLEQLEENGWDTWVLNTGGTTITSISVIFYGLFGPHPWAMLPLNSILNATASLAIFLMLLRFINDRRIALLATLPYLMFPTSLSWTAQYHNDNFMVAGVALFLFGWFQFSFSETWLDWKKIGLGVINIFIGSILIWFVRNYVLNILELFSYIIGLILGGNIIFQVIKKKVLWHKAFVAICIYLISIGLINFISMLHIVRGINKIEFGTQKTNAGSLVDLTSNTLAQENEVASNNPRFWIKTPWIPAEIDKKIKELVKTREAAFRPSSGSNLDGEIDLSNALDVARYMPRAVEIGFLAPFPFQWFEQGTKAPNTMMRRVAGIEMILIYISYIGLLYTIWNWKRSSGLWTVLIICGGMIVIYALAVVNIGTLHRFRYGFIMPIVGLGVLGWYEVFKKIIPIFKNRSLPQVK